MEDRKKRLEVLKNYGIASIITFFIYFFLANLSFNVKIPLIFTIIKSLTMPICIFIVYSSYFGIHLKEFIEQIKADIKNLNPYEILFCLKYCFLYLGIAFLITPLYAIQKNVVKDESINLYIAIFMPIFVIFEEYIFRYIILNKFSSNCIDNGILFSSICFALMHYNRFLNPLMCGIVLGIVYVSTKNIIYPILMHYAINSMLLVEFVIYIQNMIFNTHIKLELPNKITSALLIVIAIILLFLQMISNKGKEIYLREKEIKYSIVRQINYLPEIVTTFPINFVLICKILL